MRALICKFEAEILRLKSHIALINFETAVRRYALVEQKANFNPAQPRWPAGSGEISGRWSGGAGGPLNGNSDHPRVWLASDKVPETPKKAPTRKERRALAKDYLRRLAALGRLLRRGSIIGWLLDFEPEIRSYQDAPKSFMELSERALGPTEAGYQNHHIAEQDAAYKAGQEN
ncbi:MAG TPA: hypothetical protein VMH84_09495 [Xanthobacteraceae bacterium]|nr:hypothetical protein [Xanthobacteraceae bacterium]